MSKCKYEITTIKVDGTEEVHIQDKKPDYRELQRLVGGFIERVEIQYKGHKWCDLWIDEEGILKGLDYNRHATELCKGELARFNSAYDPNYYTLYGTAVIVRPCHPEKELVYA